MTPEVMSVSLGRPPKRPRLRDRLVLRDWVNHLLGFPTQQALLHFLRSITDRSPLWLGQSDLVRLLLRSPGRQALLRPEDLVRYNHNINRHVRKINSGHRRRVELRWFQRLAALYAEIFLDLSCRCPGVFLESLNAFVQSRNVGLFPGLRPLGEYTRADLRKMVFWMASGSGKTLLFHLNYHQYLHYCGARTLDNFLLVTPDEGSSERHRAELTASRIPTRRYDEPRPYGCGHRVGIIEITKLAPPRCGYGRRIPVDAFEGRNLVFVDQADRGCFGEKRRALLDELAETGFTVEYGAAFGSMRAITSNPDRADACSREVLFHYPQDQFHADGFGKDFRITALP